MVLRFGHVSPNKFLFGHFLFGCVWLAFIGGMASLALSVILRSNLKEYDSTNKTTYNSNETAEQLTDGKYNTTHGHVITKTEPQTDTAIAAFDSVNPVQHSDTNLTQHSDTN